MNFLDMYVLLIQIHVCNTKWFPFCNCDFIHDSSIKSEHCDETIYILSMILYTALRKIIIMKRLLAAMLPLKLSKFQKDFFDILNSSKKRTKKFDLTTMIPEVDLFSFVFWKNLKTPKRCFEIN